MARSGCSGRGGTAAVVQGCFVACLGCSGPGGLQWFREGALWRVWAAMCQEGVETVVAARAACRTVLS